MNKYCPKCDAILHKEMELDYPYVCLECDENFYEFEVHNFDTQTQAHIDRAITLTQYAVLDYHQWTELNMNPAVKIDEIDYDDNYGYFRVIFIDGNYTNIRVPINCLSV